MSEKVIVEILNNRGEKTRHCIREDKLSLGEYKLTCFIWVINDKEQVLLQQRSGHVKNNPNRWEVVSGTFSVDDDMESSAVIRILEKEFELSLSKDELEYIGCYKRTRDFADIWLAKSNVEKKQIVMRANKVQDIAWIDIGKLEKMVKDGLIINTGYDLFRKFYKNFYKK